jgi:hypothetical protein
MKSPHLKAVQKCQRPLARHIKTNIEYKKFFSKKQKKIIIFGGRRFFSVKSFQKFSKVFEAFLWKEKFF